MFGCSCNQRERSGCPIRQEINWFMTFQIDQNRAIILALAQCPVIDTQLAHGLGTSATTQG